MKKIDRRTAMTTAVAAGTTFAGINAVSAKTQQRSDEEKQDGLTDDQKYVMEAGMTEEESECWKKIAEAAGAFFALPELHPMDKQEVATAVHVIQNKLLGRPTYRKYLKLAKAGFAEKEKAKEKAEKQKERK